MQQSATEQRTLNKHRPPSPIHGPSVYGDIVGGITTFFTMAYIVVVNPGILASEGTGMAFSGVLTATVVLAFAMTLLMGLYARLPFAVAPGMGLNAFFASRSCCSSRSRGRWRLGSCSGQECSS
jgi:xanthine/uracil/vitamin C permease (AzgA family)